MANAISSARPRHSAQQGFVIALTKAHPPSAHLSASYHWPAHTCILTKHATRLFRNPYLGHSPWTRHAHREHDDSGYSAVQCALEYASLLHPRTEHYIRGALPVRSKCQQHQTCLPSHSPPLHPSCRASPNSSGPSASARASFSTAS